MLPLGAPVPPTPEVLPLPVPVVAPLFATMDPEAGALPLPAPVPPVPLEGTVPELPCPAPVTPPAAPVPLGVPLELLDELLAHPKQKRTPASPTDFATVNFMVRYPCHFVRGNPIASAATRAHAPLPCKITFLRECSADTAQARRRRDNATHAPSAAKPIPQGEEEFVVCAMAHPLLLLAAGSVAVPVPLDPLLFYPLVELVPLIEVVPLVPLPPLEVPAPLEPVPAPLVPPEPPLPPSGGVVNVHVKLVMLHVAPRLMHLQFASVVHQPSIPA